MSKKTMVFVYGTLKRGQHANHLLKGGAFKGQAFLPLFDLFNLGGFPTIKPNAEAKNEVMGELYEVDDLIMTKLDLYEGVASGLFKKIKVQVETEFEAVDAIAYEYTGDVKSSQPISDGIWKGRSNAA